MTHKKHIIILAAGAGTRMRSNKPKVLQPVAGRAMIEHVLATAQALKPNNISIVYGYRGDQLRSHLRYENIQWVEQTEQLGTGHAVQMALPQIADDETVLVLYGDAPLITVEDLQALEDKRTVLTAEVDDPSGYGRIVRGKTGIEAIVEEKDANTEQKAIQEINSGIIQAAATELKQWLKQIDQNNAQGELYLTDVIGIAAQAGQPFLPVKLQDSNSVKGANTMQQLAELDAIMQTRYRNSLMQSGVCLQQPENISIQGQIQCDADVVIETGAVLKGENKFGEGVVIGAYSVIENCQLAAGTVVEPHSVLQEVVTTGACSIGPFARLRPGTQLSTGCKVGNFVETKKAIFGENSKASHLSYLGDAEIGDEVNIGAGTITCNYDGVNKFKTVIEDGAFIGSDSQLVAPVTIGENATIGAGSTITKDTPANQLTVSRSRQKSISDWQRPKKKV
ncbi:bifunctional UDP-N-acetylglucosamine diphosphorylase/glucosamine-1-phosphate N-acetyltransferase GlmU [Marinicella sp. W31]|uniref:bifunctional UDP-N-acetylglucosamine diphosphorylase/glucosamine-1-phosphate N-acetyltransferase GlmU n=1 Tax=Marinicella sp. W31 TaxID=3023713 RepID=UPI003757027C